MANGIRTGGPPVLIPLAIWIAVDSIKDVVRSSVKVPEFDKYLKKAGGYISRNVVEITIKMKTVVQKPLMVNFIKLRLRNLENLLSASSRI